MAQGVRVQLVMPAPIAAMLKKRAELEGRTLSSLGTYIIESALRQQQPTNLSLPENQPDDLRLA